jgi:uncharacterized membrane protein YhaH (DUF805 family)
VTIPLDQPLRAASITEAYSRFWKKYATFSGRASRTELLWPMLVNLLMLIVAVLARNEAVSVVVGLYALAAFVPTIALGTRRLHDINRSGWWQLVLIVPVVGDIVLAVLWLTFPSPEGVKYDLAA